MYSLAAYGDMIRDRVRMEAYATAMRRAIEPGTIVVDIGTGTGIMACLACVYGAARVFAIEPGDAIEAARDIARANGLAERIEFFQDVSTSVTLPQRADVIVSDMRGVLPPFQRHLSSIIDARSRLLKPGGVLIPRRDVMHVAVAGAADLYERHVTPWERNDYGLDMQAVSRIETNAWRQCRARPEQVLLQPQRLATLDYSTIASTTIHADVRWTVARAGEAHGLLVWFDADLGYGVGFTNAPGAPEATYGQAFFPWSRPLALVAGEMVAVSVKAVLVGDEYVWSWETRIHEAGAGGRTRAELRQSSFFGVPRSRASLAKRSAGHVASLNEDGRIDRLILELIDEGLAVGRIADEVFAKFPTRFAMPDQAMARVADLSTRYSE